MINEFVPNVLVVGDAERFRARISKAGRAANIIGAASFQGTLGEQAYDILKDQTFLLDGKIVDLAALKALAERSAFDYIVFTDYVEILKFARSLVQQFKIVPSGQIITIDTFINCVGSGFCAFTNETMLYRVMVSQKIRTLLDADAYFAENNLHIQPIGEASLIIDGIFTAPVLPIFTNVYAKYYHSVADCALRHYDAILLTAERDWDSVINKFYEFGRMTETFIVFVRNNSPLTKFVDEDRWPAEFVQINYHNVINGRWFILHKATPKDAGLYVVTHKKHSVELPEGYKTIHAGRALGDDLGYIGDDTGKNISNLNPYLNEMTAAYWIWKNTSHDFVGISHYRRFFSNKNVSDFDPQNILTNTQAIGILRRYDMVVALEDSYTYNQYAFLINDVGTHIASTAITLTRMMMSIYQPDYVDVFDRVMSSCAVFRCNMMITRKYVFDAYCEWLFSFLLPAHAEFMEMTPLDKLSVNQKRAFGYLSERMMNIWLLKNNLRLKELRIMEDLGQPKRAEGLELFREPELPKQSEPSNKPRSTEEE